LDSVRLTKVVLLVPNKTGIFNQLGTTIGYGRNNNFSTNLHLLQMLNIGGSVVTLVTDDDMVYIDDIIITASSFCTPTEDSRIDI
jgi:hypothetical protein